MKELEVPARTMVLYRELAKKAIAWVLADRICDDHGATVNRIEQEIDVYLRGKQPASEYDRELLQMLEHEKIGLTLACQRETKCDEEMRQMARQLVDELELPTKQTLEVGVCLNMIDARAAHVLHVLSGDHALCAFSLETPSRWPAGHKWTSIAELREGITKIEDLSCEACACSFRALETSPFSEKRS
jgi:hypothetical protein